MNLMRVEDRVGKIRFCRRDNLDSGRFGSVFRGKYEDKVDAAINRVVHTDYLVELDVLKKAQNHPNVLRYYGSDRDIEFVFIATEVHCGSLKHLVKGTYTGPDVGDHREILRQITSGLQHLHSRKITHRDLKPSNVLISCPSSGNVRPQMKLANFGILRRAYASDLSKISLWKLSGSKGWMPPETYTSDFFTYEMDVFALGCLFGYTLNGGRHPFGVEKDERIIRIKYGQPMTMLARDLLNLNGAVIVFQLIRLMVSAEANRRPTVSEVLKHNFFIRSTKGVKYQSFAPILPPTLPRRQPAAVPARKISREEKESQEEVTISLVYPKSKKAKTNDETSVTLVKKHLPVCSSLLSPPSDSSVTLSDPSATLLVEPSESAFERPTIFRPLKAITIVKTPPRPRPLAIVQSLRPSIAAEGGASTSAARHPYLMLQPSSPIPGGSNTIVCDDSPALPIEIQETAVASVQEVYKDLSLEKSQEQIAARDEPMAEEEQVKECHEQIICEEVTAVDKSTAPEEPVALRNDEEFNTNDEEVSLTDKVCEEIPIISCEAKVQEKRQSTEEVFEDCEEEIPAIARYIQELMEEVTETESEPSITPVSTPQLKDVDDVVNKDDMVKDQEDQPVIGDATTQLQDDSQQQLDDDEPMNDEPEEPSGEMKSKDVDQLLKSDAPLTVKSYEHEIPALISAYTASQTEEEESVVDLSGTTVESNEDVAGMRVELKEIQDDWESNEDLPIEEILEKTLEESEDEVQVVEHLIETQQEPVIIRVVTQIHDEEPILIEDVAMTVEVSNHEESLNISESPLPIEEKLEDCTISTENSSLDNSSVETNKKRNSRKVVKQGQDLLFSLCQSKKWTLGMKADFRQLVQDETIPINGVNEEGLAPLLLLCWNQHSEILLELVKIVLERPDVDINVQDNGEWNALGMACRHCQSKNLVGLVRLLLERGISVNSKNQDGDSALIVLCANYKHIGLLQIARLLIEHKIDINATNSFGWNALLSICYNFKGEMLYDVIKILLEAGIKVDHIDQTGNTALTIVCSQYKRENLIDIVRLLVQDYKINVKIQNNKGWDALFALLHNYHGSNILGIMKILLDAGSNVSCKTEDGWNSILALFSQQYLSPDFIHMTRLLIEHRVDLKIKDPAGCNALIFLCSNYKGEQLIDILKLLVKNGIDVNAASNTQGWNALVFLSRNNKQHDAFIPAARLLVKAGFDIKKTENDNWNLLHFLCNPPMRKNLTQAIRYLVKETNIDRKVVDKWGKKPIDYLHKLAAEKNHKNQNLDEAIALLRG